MPLPALLERDVSKAVVDYLEFLGWRCLRMQSVVWTNPRGGVHRAGEVGMPDYLCLYYMPGSAALTVWIEFKRPGRTAKCRCRAFDKRVCQACGQARWTAEEERRGATVVRISEFKQFADFYDGHLARRVAESPRKGMQTALPLEAGK